MWEDDTQNSEYIYDCEPYQLAVKVGIIGIGIGIVYTILVRAAWLFYLISPEHNAILYSYQVGFLGLFSFVGMVFTSVGIVGIFSMKRSNLGIVFPLLGLGYHVGFYTYQYIAFQLGIPYGEMYFLATYIVAFVIALVRGLTFLTIRNVSANTTLLYFYVAFTIGYRFLADAITFALSALALDQMYIVSYTIMSIIGSFLLLLLFLQERKQGCIGAEYQEVPFPE